MLYLAGHHGLLYAFLLEGFDEARELAEREPVDGDALVGGGALVHLGVGLFADGSNHYVEVLRACRVEEEKGKAPVAGDEA